MEAHINLNELFYKIINFIQDGYGQYTNVIAHYIPLKEEKFNNNEYNLEANKFINNKRRELDNNLLKIIKNSPTEVLTFQDNNGYNLGMYAINYELKLSANYIYQNKVAREQKNYNGENMLMLARNTNMPIKINCHTSNKRK